MKSLLPAFLLGLGLTPATAVPVAAYPVDCAILLCLAGGWPGSAVCAHAQAVFIRRITPWPIEPPLQIWNCPMRASFRAPTAMERLFDINVRHGAAQGQAGSPVGNTVLQRVAGQADIDISDPAFDFVRSIRVFEIRYTQHSDDDGGACNRWWTIHEGSYDEQGGYRRRRSTPSAVPEASDLDLTTDCRTIQHRSVFVEWRDAEGTYSHEEVHY
ncbi:hypothetical protein SAMN04488103_11444 [Gemmobacter aquatilis]|uniref:Uncharacterized protein n=1 Tax=Gemmobacter aquatilis TaxID=933059 RepID=A0A1H8MRX5_9RHOB|nr:hypothetical protein [Gemmobacter aquatilis]SEO20049.1 hypothetical protein SAMN04488103_11444 [Gemmobacter aquatilis]